VLMLCPATLATIFLFYGLMYFSFQTPVRTALRVDSSIILAQQEGNSSAQEIALPTESALSPQPKEQTICQFAMTRTNNSEAKFAMKAMPGFPLRNYWVLADPSIQQTIIVDDPWDDRDKLLIVPHNDSYMMLYKKTELMFQFISDNINTTFSECDWIIKVDDDTFINYPLLKETLRCRDPMMELYSGYFGRGFQRIRRVDDLTGKQNGIMGLQHAVGACYFVSRGLALRFDEWMENGKWQLTPDRTKKLKANRYLGEDLRFARFLLKHEVCFENTIGHPSLAMEKTQIWFTPTPNMSREELMKQLEPFGETPDDAQNCLMYFHKVPPKYFQTIAYELELRRGKFEACRHHHCYQRNQLDPSIFKDHRKCTLQNGLNKHGFKKSREVHCRPWDCSCQNLSDLYGFSPQNTAPKSTPSNLLRVPKYAPAWWKFKKCKTSPKIYVRPPSPLKRQNLHAKVCYLVKETLEKEETNSSRHGGGGGGGTMGFSGMPPLPITTTSTTTSSSSSSSVVFLLRKKKKEGGGGGVEREGGQGGNISSSSASNTSILASMFETGSINYYQDPKEGEDEDQNEDIILFDLLSLEHETLWKDKCDWFVRTSSDVWINKPLMARRLQCLNPSSEIYSGTVLGRGDRFFVQGNVVILSARIMQLFHFYLKNWRVAKNTTKLLPTLGWDQKLAEVLQLHNIQPSEFAWRRQTIFFPQGRRQNESEAVLETILEEAEDKFARVQARKKAHRTSLEGRSRQRHKKNKKEEEKEKRRIRQQLEEDSKVSLNPGEPRCLIWVAPLPGGGEKYQKRLSEVAKPDFKGILCLSSNMLLFLSLSRTCRH